jgi:hypothetical protein
LHVIATQGLLYYQTLSKPELIELIQQRDSELLACRQDVLKMTEEFKRVQRILNLRNKKLFGSSSEKSSRLVLQLDTKSAAIESIEFEEVPPAQDDQTATGPTGEKLARKKRYAKPHPGRYALPEELPRVERHLYPEGYDSSWNRELPEERTERFSLKIELFVEVLVRHKFARELDAIAIAPYPPNDPFFRHKFTTELVAGMFVMHAGMHLTHYQFHQQFLARYGISYTSVIDNMRKAHTLLEPLGECLHQAILQDAVRLNMDETRFSLLDTPANIAAARASLDAAAIELGLKRPASARKTKGKKTKPGMGDDDDEQEVLPLDMSKGKVLIKGQMWMLYNETAKLVLFAFSPTWATVNAVKLLSDFKGQLMADAYTVYRRIAKLIGIDLILLTCWAHARRGFLESYDHARPDPVVREVLIRIGELYKIEKAIKDRSPEDKLHARKKSIPILESLHQYLVAQLPQYAPKEAVAQAIQYCLNHWKALSAYPHYPHAPIDNNEAERVIRPITISRKTSLFLGSVEQARGASLAYSLMECCRLHAVNQFEYMNDVLKIIETYPKEKLTELLPHNWKKARGNNKAPS